MRTQIEKNWAVALHLMPFTGALIPLAGIVAPIAVWCAKRGQSEYLDAQGKEVINLLICESVVGAIIVAMGLLIPAMRQFSGGAPNPFADFLLPAMLVLTVIPLAVLGIALPILAAVKCSNGEDFRYPFITRLVK